jgi:large subunit ribosomal protein L24
MKIILNDKVIIIAGKDKGKTGKVTKVFVKAGKVIVAGANQYKRHLKKQSGKNPGGIVSIERPLPVANVMLICPQCKKSARVGYAVAKTGEKYRICKQCHQQINVKN